MTNTTLTWIGIVSQAIPAITAILMVTVGNCKRNDKQKTIKDNFWTITKQEIINEFKQQ